MSHFGSGRIEGRECVLALPGAIISSTIEAGVMVLQQQVGSRIKVLKINARNAVETNSEQLPTPIHRYVAHLTTGALTQALTLKTV